MKQCPNCGNLCDDNVNFCNKCGASLSQNNTYQNNTYQNGNYQNGNYQNGGDFFGGGSSGGGYVPAPGPGNTGGIMPRSIVVAIVLTIVTCGIYGIYWMIKLNDEINQLSGEYQATSGVMVFLFGIITCGIYYWYWQYKMGQRCDRINRVPNGSSGILYLVLAFFGLGIVGYCLMQDTINKAVSR